CKSVHIVTNAHFEDEISELLSKTKNTNNHQDLIVNSQLAKLILEFFQTEFDDANVNYEAVFDFLKKIELDSNAGKLNDIEGDQEAIYLGRIYEYTEVSLEQAQAKKIASSLIDLVRRKSMRDIPENVSEEELDQIASIEFNDVLNILSLSKAAYEELRKGGDDKALKSTSILQRLLKRCNASETMIVSACKAKVAWDNWIRNNRHIIGESDYFVLESLVKDVVYNFSSSNLSLHEMVKSLAVIPNKLEGKIPSAITLDTDLIFGLFWAIIVKEELF
ncbi:TPA: hypothetical protein ACT9M1_003039, partial [Legionella pneumophila]